MEKRVKALLFRLPVTIIMLIVVIGGFAVKITKLPINGAEIGWLTPITILLLFGLYLVGEYFSLKLTSNSF